MNRIINRNNIYILSSEIFTFFNRIPANYKNRILQIIINNIDFYNEQFLNQVMISQNASLINSLKNNLLNHQDDEIKELAAKKGIL